MGCVARVALLLWPCRSGPISGKSVPFLKGRVGFSRRCSDRGVLQYNGRSMRRSGQAHEGFLKTIVPEDV
jgi:hypothetical protein